MKIKEFNNIYQFKISLKGIKPKIWRRIQVPENYSFWDLHVAIQDVMGWFDCHLHQFHVNNQVTGGPEFIGIPNDDKFEDEVPILPGWEMFISDFFSLNKKNFLYEYDFGDSWNHDIFLEKILSKKPDTIYPICLAGERACPPEDCGGSYGYEDFIKIIKDPQHKEYKNMMKWSGGNFDPELFDPSEVVFTNPKSRLKMLGLRGI